MISFAVPLALAASALANVFITSPVATTTLAAGQNASITWQDDGTSPSLAQFGNASFAIYVGNAIQQTPLQTIAASVNVSAISSLAFTPLASIGPNSNEYFIRVTSLSYMNPSSPQYYEEAFSAKFTLSGMTGTFNSSIQAEIDGQSTAPIGGTATPGSASPTAGGAPGSAITSAAKTSAPAATATSTSANGAGKPVMATGLVGLVATLIAASSLL